MANTQCTIWMQKYEMANFFLSSDGSASDLGKQQQQPQTEKQGETG